MKNKKCDIYLARPYFDQAELNEVKEVLDSGWVSQGPKVKEFEQKIAAFLGIEYAVAVTNCTSALHISLLAIGVKKNDEVIVSDFTFPATGHSVVYCGATPIFNDINLKTYNIDVYSIEENITSKTKAVVPVHTFGQPADMDTILKIAKEYNLKVIEDAACALGAKYRGKYAGTFGDVGCFSFHARKGITTGEGGMVITNNKDLAEKIRHLSVFGMTTAWDREKSDKIIIPEFNEIGYNYKMSDITAAIGVAQLRKLNTIIKRRADLAKYWSEKLEEISYIEPPYCDRYSEHVYQSYVALVNKGINRNKLIKKLADRRIQTQIGTYASHIQPVYHSRQICPNSLDVYNRSIALPLYYTLKEEDIDVIISHLKNFEEFK